MTSDSRLSLQEAVARFFVLKASHLLGMEEFPRRQDLDVEPMAPQDCYLLLFISHRWETPNHPDPSGKQLAGLKSLIYLICDACNALSAKNNEEKLSFLPSLRRYGALHAILLIARLSSTILTTAPEARSRNTREWLPEHIGVWYDFACLPQTPRTEEQESEFQKTLLALPDLLLSPETSLIAIRDVNDDYESRGWCFAEARLSSEKMAFRSLALRLDRIGTISNLQTSAVGRSETKAATQFEASVEAWEEIGPVPLADTCWENIVLQASLTPEMLPLSEDDSPVLSLSRMAYPSLEWVCLLLVELARHEGREIDFAQIVVHLLREKGLQCSEDNDLIYVGLLALLWSCQEQSRLAAFFRECLTRHVAAKGLVMRVTTRDQSKPGINVSSPINSANLTWKFL